MKGRSSSHSARSIALRLLAAAAIVAVAFATRELVLADDPVVSDSRGSRVITFEFESDLLGESRPVEVVIPPGAKEGERSLLIFLHERGADESTYLNSEMFAGLVAQGGKAPVLAFPRGGPDSYWHDREDGAWGSHVLEEVLPAVVDRFEIAPSQVAIGGISMGGFGAIDIARQAPERFCAVGAHSAALWEDNSGTAPGAFDNEEDFAEHDVIELSGPPLSPFAGRRVWLDIGESDPFLEANQALEAQLLAGTARTELLIEPGRHENAYWNSNWRRYMTFYATQLKRCAQEREADEQSRNEEERGAESSGSTRAREGASGSGPRFPSG